MSDSSVPRRQFFRGVAVGPLAGLGLDLRAVRAAAARLKIRGAQEFVSVCPYCAVGCSQIVSVRDRRIVNIEGNPDSPINEGTLCPKGAAAYQLAVNPHRLTRVQYRKPFARDWEEVPLGWAMDRIARLVKQTRDETFTETWVGPDGRSRRVNHCGALASLGGATMDNEWNYAHLKLWRALGGIWIENQARI